MNENQYMSIAIQEAQKAFDLDEVPVGAVIVKNGQIIAQAHNIKEKTQKITKHAELIAIEMASEKLSNWRLNDCEIYITLEPCPMCASAIHQARIQAVYYGTSCNDYENTEIINKIFNTVNRNKSITKIINYDCKKCKNILQNYFKLKRNL